MTKINPADVTDLGKVKTVENKALRFAPGRDRERLQIEGPSFSIWKIWAEGSEVYALSRMMGSTKLSAHASGQIHLTMAAKQKHILSPPTRIGTSVWTHAVELRFLRSDDALKPPDQKPPKKKKDTVFLIALPDGFALIANLIFAPAGSPLDLPLPIEFAGASALWRTKLRDGRIVVLISRVLPLDDKNREHIENLRKIQINTSEQNSSGTTPKNRYAEILYFMGADNGSNIILVVAAGSAAFQPEESPDETDQAARTVDIQIDGRVMDLVAPDGQTVGVIEIADLETQAGLVKGKSSFVELGQINLRIFPERLVAGSAFIIPPFRILVDPVFSGARFPRWNGEVHARFDGSCLTAQIAQTSGSLRNENLRAPITIMLDDEELLVTLPADRIILSATLDEPLASATINCRLTLRRQNVVKEGGEK
jgi:hypothetical protein